MKAADGTESAKPKRDERSFEKKELQGILQEFLHLASRAAENKWSLPALVTNSYVIRHKNGQGPQSKRYCLEENQ